MRRALASLAMVAIASVALAACETATAPRFAVERQYPSADETARAFLTKLASGGDVERDPRAGPAFASGKLDARLRAVRALFPKAAPASIKVATWGVSARSDGGTAAELTYAWKWPHQTLLVRTALVRGTGDERWFVTGVEARRKSRGPALASAGDLPPAKS
jgi:hypothetical protein